MALCISLASCACLLRGGLVDDGGPASCDAHARLTAPLRRANDVALTVATSYCPATRFPDLEARRREYPSRTKLCAACGILRCRRVKTSVATRPLTDEGARFLQLPRSRWVFQIRKVDTDPAGVPICVSGTCRVGDRVQFVIDHSEHRTRPS